MRVLLGGTLLVHGVAQWMRSMTASVPVASRSAATT